MPLYEYKCPKCGHRFEKIEKVTAPRQRNCPNCKGRAKRLQSAPAIHFKGAGWYVTDYARKSSGGDAKPEKSEKPTAETKEKTEKKEPAKKDQKQK